MTNEQLTQEVMRISEHQVKSETEHERFAEVIKELQEDMKATKKLAEDVHIMAINIQNMQRTLEQTNKKVDSIASEEFLEYKENKKALKSKVIVGIASSFGTLAFSALVWFIKMYIENGGM